MHIHIKGLAPGLVRQSQKEPAGAVGFDEEKYHFTKPISAQFALEKVGQQIICRAVVQTSLMLKCSRCLEPVEVELSERMTLLVIFYDAGQPAAGEEEVKVVPADAEKVDVTEEIRQTVLLAIPFKPLCGEGCLGLCPQCGTNLNEKRCRCQQKVADPRWAGLKKFMPDKNTGEESGRSQEKDLQVQKG
jgi:uncharacterized protein